VAFVKELTYAGIGDEQDEAVVLGRPAAEFIAAVAAHRNWDREIARKVPA
jgi:hypothetical protein